MPWFSQGYLTKFESTQNVQFWLRLNEKMAEQAEHTQVCEHWQKWTLHGFHEAALLVQLVCYRLRSIYNGSSPAIIRRRHDQQNIPSQKLDI